jgi:mono/diheme cytochrome c family protein
MQKLIQNLILRSPSTPAGWWLFIFVAAVGELAAADTKVDFERDIQPILAGRCYECHGEKKQKSEFRLDNKTDAMRGGESGKPAILPGNSAASPLIQRITNPDKDEVMPKKGERLTTEQIALFKAWIDQVAAESETSAKIITGHSSRR